MVDSLEDIAEKETNDQKKASFYDSLVSAFSSGKAVQTAITTAVIGSPIYVAGLSAICTYLGFKTLGGGIKYIARVIRHPIQYIKPSGIGKSISETVKSYNPFKHTLPTKLGGVIGGLNYVT